MAGLGVVLAALLIGRLGSVEVAGREFVISAIDLAGPAVAVWGLALAWRRRRIRLDGALLAYLAFGAVLAAQIVTDDAPLQIVGGASRFVVAALVVLGLSQLLDPDDPRPARLLPSPAAALAWFGAVLGALVLVELGRALANPDLHTFYEVKNAIVLRLGASNYLAGIVLVPAAYLTADAIFEPRRWWRGILPVAAVLATLSRAAAVALLVALAVAAVGRVRPRAGLMVGAAAAVATLAASITVGMVGAARVGAAIGPTAVSRIDLLGATWDGFTHHVALGVGLNDLLDITSGLPEPHVNAHNLALHALATTGVLGTVAYLALWVVLAWRLWTATDDPGRIALAAAATALFVHAAAEALAYTRAVEALVAVLLVAAGRLPGAQGVRVRSRTIAVSSKEPS